ncbi:tetratricopeptide repeat protein [Streptomyces sp. NBC_01190]|uniref:tetratricopeptide repeat protein n=1 Tax=Streptomyces sp. NBC_01190 TaxID=2903767 RepID=UPI00386E563B|nr:tetratricopeptide repeat protein [Streptomyces sp. NBC_01190]
MSEAPAHSAAESRGAAGPTGTALAPWYGLSVPYREPAPAPLGQGADPPHTPDELRMSAESAYHAGDFETATRLILAAIEGYRSRHDAWGVADALAVRGSMARSTGDTGAAVPLYHEALSLFNIVGDLTSTARLYRALAEVCFTTGDYEGSAAVQLEGLALLPDDPVLLAGLGYALWYSGHEANALTYLTRALTAQRDNTSARFARGQIQADLGRAVAALADLDPLGGSADGPPERRADLASARGVCLIAIGRTAAGEAELRGALLAAPQRARTHRRIADVRLRAGDVEQARASLRAAAAAADPLPPAHADRARRLLDRLALV